MIIVRKSFRQNSHPPHLKARIPALTRCHYQIAGLRTPYSHIVATIGDALRKRRLDQGLTIKNVGEQLKVNEATIHNWETNRRTVQLRFLGRVCDFLGVCPCDVLLPMGVRLKERRVYAGITRKVLAQILKVDGHTISAWEESNQAPTAANIEKILQFLDTSTARVRT
ncbi:MAG: helix-turn-helix transcriptional regulator [Chloracidobacterium sp.]|nr:helix-turn-helix transcriptional regulator [Chloracidobacterium sp.]